VSTLIHASVYDFTTFAECIGTNCRYMAGGGDKNYATALSLISVPQLRV
jgi:hypothetical protein